MSSVSTSSIALPQRRSFPSVAVAALVRGAVGLALVKSLLGLVILARISLGRVAEVTTFPAWILVMLVVVFGGVGAWLVAAGHRDRRAQLLGGYFLLSSAMFTARVVAARTADVLAILTPIAAVLASTRPESFLPLLLWSFAREFPKGRPLSTGDRVARGAVAASAVVGVALFIVAGLERSVSLPRALAVLAPGDPSGLFWPILIILLAPALPFMMLQARSADLSERRRVGLFVASLIAGSAPIMIDVLLEMLVPAFGRLMSHPRARWWSGAIVFPCLIAIPFATAYAVVVHQVLDVTLVVRKALQYALARYTVIAASAVPFLGLAWFLFERRNLPLTSILSGPAPIALILLTAAGMATLRVRRRMLDGIDRRFFREEYDSRIILSALVEQSRAAETIPALSNLLTAEIERALHVRRVVLFMPDLQQHLFLSVTGLVRPLPADSGLAMLVSGAHEPLDIDIDDPKSALRRLPADEGQWIADSQLRLIVPLMGSAGTLVGFVGLGEKRSELPFALEDRLLLAAIAASVGLTIENRTIRSSHGSGESIRRQAAEAIGSESTDGTAVQCIRCGAVLPASRTTCRCGGAVEPAPVPLMLLGKFQFEQQIGSGGMGIVYRARDLALHRVVAIKTLPSVRSDYVARLHREARAMASVLHPGLALIFAVENWHGTPMLVVEYLEGGTLADRLKLVRRLPLREALTLVLSIGEALQHLHASGVLHRDIKPSNIGFTVAGQPKLLDFGLARLLDDAATPQNSPVPFPRLSEASTTSLAIVRLAGTDSHHVVGTPLYLSPEAVAGEAPDTSFDLWSLTVVLYESLAGVNPFVAANVFQTLDRISRVTVPDARTMIPECPEEVALFFSQALAMDKARRPGSARDLTAQVSRVMTAVFKDAAADAGRAGVR
jgi:eukaryotic-like serine/threonine-protein kinase